MGIEKRLRFEIKKCRKCEACRELVGFSCLVFPEMFALVDRERDTNEKISTADLNRLTDLCNFCGACPCLDIRAALLEYKTDQVEKNGLPLKIRAIENVELIGRVSSAFPKAANFVLQNKTARKLLQEAVGIHEKRQMPIVGKESLNTWFNKKKAGDGRHGGRKRKVAYFAGCSARYLFPEVGRALVNILEQNECDVHFFPQRCCGMPTFLEGDRKKTLALASFNLDRMAEVIKDGYEIVCSCPTCGYFLKVMLTGGFGVFSGLENSVPSDGILKIPKEKDTLTTDGQEYYHVSEKVMRHVVKSNDYFSSLDPGIRNRVADHTFDAGEYLMRLYEKDELNMAFSPAPGKVTYFPPCHQREQRIGQPYVSILKLIGGTDVEAINGEYCCGNGGIMGFKKDFFRHSLRIGSRLVTKVRSANPDVLSTECLSCRMQLDQMTVYRVKHPLEILEACYASYTKPSVQADKKN
ncbi:MAG: hypothetical protein HOK67_31420 [Deltaproteobacteria bacterium]|jgi:glycerol-3-phosphate dehydrogenase subunit C|nr:hypothetical protein [Deltaproteobacteria bacterium]MBT4644463.1 hypothetical protein [Deltaproteobacteria bacterium]MBT6504405.1 hypothetical protein [Deltaproteobacteria bacterium]MBT7713800.1 hypothetical protein [Deltaproteobacteria bacterium]